MSHLRDAGGLLITAVNATIDALDLDEADAAAVRLARHYANTIDQNPDPGWAMRWIAPLLLDCLEQLGATPAARARLKTGKPGDVPVSQLAKLRAARRA
jgi:hypothetical protein